MLNQTVTQGTAPSLTLAYDNATNRITTAGYGYDANGNMTASPAFGATYTYDASNRRTMFTLMEYGPDANCFIRQRLSTQGELWRLLLRLPIEEGKVTAYLPREFPLFDLKHFAWSLITAEERESSSVDLEYMRQTLRFVLNYLRSGTDCVAVFRA